VPRRDCCSPFTIVSSGACLRRLKLERSGRAAAGQVLMLA
jgi:hypothetical protein